MLERTKRTVGFVAGSMLLVLPLAIAGGQCGTEATINNCLQLPAPDTGQCYNFISNNSCIHYTPSQAYQLGSPYAGGECRYQKGTLDEFGNCVSTLPNFTSGVVCRTTISTPCAAE